MRSAVISFGIAALLSACASAPPQVDNNRIALDRAFDRVTAVAEQQCECVFTYQFSSSFHLGATVRVEDGNPVIIISSEIMALAQDENEIAFVIAHETAHYLLGHTTSSHQHEFEADILGTQIAASVGYDAVKAVKLISRLEQIGISNGIEPGSTTHPSYTDRLNAIKSLLTFN